ncbi:hypothetical protein CKM354_001005100 [Cercospora kikuchii]|uniref:Uncharacterized protein n=1 Tax=Cercospora kikuchii TaxID=84275 RepID=A0A9P3CYI6_9PEZI|nr:uncharacterized protein CKM354_001005100 [Cercospora kikuchii]GIZ46948.1 hypothetical protein CKM354_001005100 [Cercospora kikuchii]
MHTSIFSFCLSIFASAALSIAQKSNTGDLEPRAIIQQPDAEPAISQAPSVTTIWMETTIGTSPTYVPVVFTQTFASVPDQWPAPKSGAIGYGTLHKDDKRAEAEATPAPTATAAAAAVVDVSEKNQASEDEEKHDKRRPTFHLSANILTSTLHLLAITTTTSSSSSSSSPFATAFVIELQTLIHTVGVQPVIEVTELTEITRDVTVEAEDENKPLSITSTRNVNDTRPTFPAEMSPEYMRTKLAGLQGGGGA